MSKIMATLKDLKYPLVITAVMIGSMAIFQNATTIQSGGWVVASNLKNSQQPPSPTSSGGGLPINHFDPNFFAFVPKFTTNSQTCDYRIRQTGRLIGGTGVSVIANSSSVISQGSGIFSLKFHYSDLTPILGFHCLGTKNPVSLSGVPSSVILTFTQSPDSQQYRWTANFLNVASVCGMTGGMGGPSSIAVTPYALSLPSLIGTPGAYGSGNIPPSVQSVVLEQRCYSTSLNGVESAVGVNQ